MADWRNVLLPAVGAYLGDKFGDNAGAAAGESPRTAEEPEKTASASAAGAGNTSIEQYYPIVFIASVSLIGIAIIIKRS